MKKLIFLFFILSYFQVYATKYFVKVSGNDNSSGLNDLNAWSLNKLSNTTVQPDDSIFFKRGDIFYGVLYPVNSGTSGHTIYYGAYGTGANPRFSGFRNLAGWVQASGNIYYSSLDIDGRSLAVTVSGIIQNIARFPKTGYLTFTGYGNRFLTVNPADLPISVAGGEVVIKKNRSVIDRHKVVNLTGTSLNYEQDFQFLYGYNLNDPSGGTGYFVQNTLSCLTSDKDWYYDKAQKRLYMYFTNNPANYNVQATVDFYNITFDSRSYLTFENIDVEGAAISGINGSNGSDIVFTNCNSYNQAGTGFAFGSVTNLKYTQSTINKTGDAGFSGGNNVNYLLDRIIVKNAANVEGTAKSGDGSGNGINIYQGSGLVTRCKAINSGFNGISVVADYIDVEKCFVDTSCTIKDDGGGIYVYNPNRNGNDLKIIKNNISLNSFGTTAGAKINGLYYGLACGIYLDNLSTNITVDNNFCANGGWTGILNNGGKNNTITNNTCYNFEIGQFIHNKAGIGSPDVSGNTVSGNTFIARTASQYCMYFYTNGVDNPSIFGTYNNNIYARPVDDIATISENGTNSKSLADWKSYTGQDVNSKKSAFTIPDASRLRFDYNYSASSATNTIIGLYQNMQGLNYNPVIPAYSGRVSAQYFNAPSVHNGKTIQSNGKLVTRKY